MRKGTKRKTTKKGEPKSKPVEAEKNEPSQSEIEQAEETKPEEPSPNAEPEPSKEAAGKGKRKRGKVAEPAAEPEPSKEAAGKGRGKRVKVAEPAAEPDAEPSKEAAGKGRRKRVKVAEPEAEPEYFPEKRNLEDLWQQVFPVGTEWDQMDMVYEYKWNFSNLEEALEEGGELHNKKVYLFGCTEPQLVPFKDQSKVTMIPVVVAVVSPFPPSDKIGIKSVQRETEEIVPMKQMKMDWVPYIPLEDRESQVERLKNPQIFILSCNQRRAGLSHLKIERVKKFEYCLPYFYDPLQEDELEQSTVVPILYPIDPKPVFCEFDWEFDEVEEFTDKLIEDEELTADQKDEFKKFLEEKIREAKKANRAARDARKKAREEMNQQAKDAFKNMQFYKFYPGPSDETPDVSGVKAPFINRYYGKAHKVI